MTKEKHGEDPLDQIREVRDEHARKFNYDVDAIIADIKHFGREKKLKTINLPPKKIDTTKKTG